jgi:hypothetical protein
MYMSVVVSSAVAIKELIGGAQPVLGKNGATSACQAVTTTREQFWCSVLCIQRRSVSGGEA